MLRTIGAIIAGLLAGALLQGVVEALGHKVFPPPADLSLSNPEQIKAYIQSAPPGALLFPLAAVSIGSFMGGLVANAINKTSAKPALIVGILFTTGSVMNVIMLPHPLRLGVLYVILPLPAAYAGGWLMSRRLTESDAPA